MHANAFYTCLEDAMLLCWIVSANMTQITDTWKEGNSTEELPPSDLPMGIPLRHFFLLLSDEEGPGQL